MYCEECKESHKTSPIYPGKKLIYNKKHTKQKKSTRKKVINATLDKCECCKDCDTNLTLHHARYECGIKKHNGTYCLQCAMQHRMCQVDFALETMSSSSELVNKLDEEDDASDSEEDDASDSEEESDEDDDSDSEEESEDE